MKKTYTITFKGSAGGAFIYVNLILGTTPIPLKSTDGGVTWTNPGITINYVSPLHIHLDCGALSGTTWDITVQEKGGVNPCYSDNGTTGDNPGAAEPNKSIRDLNSTC